MPDTEDGPVTLITTLQVDPEHLDEVLSRLQTVQREVMPTVPGHLGATIHVSLDRSKIHLAGKWDSRASVDAILFNEEFGKHLDFVTENAKSQESVLYRRAET